LCVSVCGTCKDTWVTEELGFREGWRAAGLKANRDTGNKENKEKKKIKRRRRRRRRKRRRKRRKRKEKNKKNNKKKKKNLLFVTPTSGSLR